MGPGVQLQASYGLNKFVIKHPRFFNQAYPAHIKSATFYGRVLNADNIINLDMEFTYDDEVRMELAWGETV